MINALRLKYTIVTILLAISFEGMSQLSIVSTLPAHNSSEIPTNTKLVIKFNGKVFPGEGSIFIYTNGYEVMQIYSDDIYITYSTDQVTIDLPEELDTETEYLIHIDDDAFVSQSGNYLKSLGTASEWSFITAKNIDIEKENEPTEPLFYPNPAITEIRFKNLTNVESLHISNLTGRSIFEVKSPDTRISLRSIPKGMYFITFLMNDGKRITKKLIKQ